MSSQSSNSVVCAALIAVAGLVCPGVSQAAFVVYDQTLHTSPQAVANPNAGDFGNCLAAEGCFGKNGLVDTTGGDFPSSLAFVFSLTAAQVASITAGPGAQATLMVVASRDIGHKSGASADDFLGATADSVSLGKNLFIDTIDSCPPGERGSSPSYPSNLVCGPNFHTDVTATDQISIGTADITSFVADGSVNVVLTPSATMGRLKVFSVELLVTQVPEPSSFVIIAGGIFALGFALRARKA